MKKGAASMRNRISAWILTLVMIVGLVAVPAGEAQAEETPTWNLSVASGSSENSVTMVKNGFGEDYIGDVPFDTPSVAQSKSALQSNGITSMEVKLTVKSFTADSGSNAPSVMLYAQPGEDGKWEWNASDGVKLVADQQITLTYDFSGMNWGGGSTMGHLGIRFANCANGSTVSFTIDSAKLIGGGSQGGEIETGGNTSNEVTATITKLSGNSDWAEFNYSVTNGTDSPISGIQIKVPANGTVNNLKGFNCSAQYSGGYIIISHTKVLEAGTTYTCDVNTKFGFAGGASLGTPVVEFTYGEDGGGTSSGALNYELTGETKNVAFDETPVGKHGKLRLEQIKGYTAPVIVDENGEPFQLRGASTHGMHWEDAGGPFVNKGAFQSLRDEWGVNMVRLVSYVTQGGYTEGKSDVLDNKIQTGVEAATDLGMYVIIDWHIHHENPHDTKSKAQEFFTKYATMYKDYDNVIFEICNEPTGVEWYNGSGGDLYSYCKDIATTIRNCGSKALIVCGTNTWSQDVDDVAQKPLEKDGFENILYTFHFYSGSHYDNLMDKVRTATAAGTPIFVTEFGICDASGNTNFDTANADKWIALCDQNNISYCCWSLSNKNESASYLKPECGKTQGGWTEGDLATTGIWLVNTYRSHQDKEENTDTSKGEISVSIVPQSGQLDAVAEGYSDPGSFVITVTNSGNKELTDLSAAFGRGANTSFEITKNFESTTLDAGDTTTLEISLKNGKSAGTYSDSVIIKSGSMKKALNIKQEVSETIVPVESVTVTPAKLSMVKGDTSKLTATVLPAEATNKQVRWSSSAPEVAEVSADGTVTAVGTGEAKVTATTVDGGEKATCTVTVTNPIKDFTIEPTEVSLYVGESKTITVTPIPADADPYKVTWKSDAEGVAEVDADGKITAKAKGTAKITATIDSITKTCNVTVSVPLEGIQFEQAEVALKKGETTELNLIPEPEGAIIKSVKYTSEKPSVATVSSEGEVTAVASGTTTITAESEGKIAKCTVTVTTPVTGVKFIENADKIELEVNETFDLSKKYEVIPKDADNKEVNWESSDETKVTVTEEGLVTAVGKTDKGKPVTITITTVDGDYKAESQVSVVGVKVTGITLEQSTLSVNVVDKIDLKEELAPKVEPATADDATITWKSSDTDVAEVDASGILTAKKAGEAVITAQAGNCTATCTVTVQKNPQATPSVTLTKVSRTSYSITVSAALSSAQENTSGQLELSIDSGKSWEKVDEKNQVTFSGLKEFTPYTVKARLAATDAYEASEPAKEDLTVYTLVKDPYTVDVSKFADKDMAKEYADALRTADNKEPTVAYDADEKKLTLSEPGEKYTITGDNEDLTIVTGTGNYDMTLKDATVKEVEASASGAVDMEIQGQVTVKDGVTASGDTDITIHGQSRQDKLTTPFVSTEGDLTVKQVTVEADAAQTEKPALAGDTVTIDDAAVNAAGGIGKPAVEGNEVDLKNNPELQLKSDAGQKGIDAKDIVIEDKADVTFSGEEKDKYSVPPVDSNGNPYEEQKNPEEQKDPVKPQEPADDKTAITSITVSLPAATMEVGDAVKATATVQPANADNEVLWSSSNSNVLTVSDTGMVTAIAAGTADVIATAADGSGKSGRFTVTVVDTEEDEDDSVEATGLAVTASVKGAGEIPVKGTMKLALKKKLTLNVEFLPEDAEEEDVTFTSSNPKVAQVNDEGTVTGKKAGKAVITVKSDSGLQKTVKIQVMKKPVSKVKIKASKTTIKVKKTVKLKAVVTPNKKLASNGIFWKSSNPKIATVSASGVVKGVKKGKVKITAVATDGSGKKATVTIKIN